MSRFKSRAMVFAFCAVAGGGLVSLWSGSSPSLEGPKMLAAVAAEASPLPVPSRPSPVSEPAKLASEQASASMPLAAPPPTFLDQVRKQFPSERPFDPLDLTPERIRILEQAFQLVMTLRARDLELTGRERALDAARLELEARIKIFESEMNTARDGYRKSVRDELAERERATEAKLALVAQQQELLDRLKSELRRDVGERFEKIISAYQNMKPKVAARVLQEKDPTDVAAIMFLLPDDQRTRIFSEMDPALVRAVLKGPFAEELDAARQGRNGRAPQRP